MLSIDHWHSNYVEVEPQHGIDNIGRRRLSGSKSVLRRTLKRASKQCKCMELQSVEARAGGKVARAGGKAWVRRKKRAPQD